jgi:hypothetical protein
VSCKKIYCFVKRFSVSLFRRFAKRFAKISDVKQTKRFTKHPLFSHVSLFRDTEVVRLITIPCLVGWSQPHLLYLPLFRERLHVSLFRKLFHDICSKIFRETFCETDAKQAEKFHEVAARFAYFAVSRNSNKPFQKPYRWPIKNTVYTPKIATMSFYIATCAKAKKVHVRDILHC